MDIDQALAKIEDVLETLYQIAPDMRDCVEMLRCGYGIELSEGGYPIWDHCVMETVEFLLEEPTTYKNLLEQFFSFVEHYAKTSDVETHKFYLHLTMVYIYNKKSLLDTAKKFMEPATKAAWEEYCVFKKKIKLLKLSQLYSDEELEAMKQM